MISINMVSEGDLILCTVERIEHTTVFVRLATGEEGTIIISEIAPGRIRNLRDYVLPNKKIVCKVIRISGNNIDLSLRRVNSKEKKEVLEKYKQEQTIKSAFNQILKEKAKEIQEKIEKEMPLAEFLQKAKEDEKIITKYIPSEFREVIKKITQKKQKEIEVKKLLKLKCLEPDGIVRIKKILSVNHKNIKITYISAGNFQISAKAEDYKEANKQVDTIVKNMEIQSKQCKCEFEALDK